MRRLILFLVAVSFGLACWADDTISVVKIFDDEACSLSDTNYSKAIDLDVYRPGDTAKAVQAVLAPAVTGTPEVVLYYEVSLDGTSYFTPAGATNDGALVTNLTTSGFYQFDPGVTKWLRIKAVTTDATNGVLNAWLAVQ